MRRTIKKAWETCSRSHCQILASFKISSVILNRSCPLGDIWQCLETCFVVTTGVGLLTFSKLGWRMLFNILKCTGQPHTTESYPALDVSGDEIETSWYISYTEPLSCVLQTSFIWQIVFRRMPACPGFWIRSCVEEKKHKWSNILPLCICDINAFV